MPRFSIIMPTYNRAEVIRRAIASILAQRYLDWELIVVDDGSSDATREQIAKADDPRIRLFSQENQGVTRARNAGLRAARGDLIAFLDSDDEWLPHHLELASAFFEAFPGEHVFSGEFWGDYGDQRYVKHHRIEASTWAPLMAKRIGSRAFEGRAPEDDPYLRFYETRAKAGPWAARALREILDDQVFHYRGNIFRAWRWEFQMAMQSTVITRKAFETVGPMPERYRVSSDYGWLAAVSNVFPVNLLNVPSCIKHEYGTSNKHLAEGHLVTGKTAVQFHQEMLEMFEELFFRVAPDDPELQGIRAYRQFKVAEAALLWANRTLAVERAAQAVRAYRGLDAKVLLWLARIVPSPLSAAKLYRLALRLQSVPSRLLRRLIGVEHFPSHEVPGQQEASSELTAPKTLAEVVRRGDEPDTIQ